MACMADNVTAPDSHSCPNVKPRGASWLILTIGIAAISTASILIRLTDAPSLVIGAYRMLISALLLTPLALPRSIAAWRLLNKQDVLLLCLSGVALAAHFAAWIASLSLTTVSSSVILVTTNPIFV